MKVTGRTSSGVSSLGITQDGKTTKGARAGVLGDWGQVSISPEAMALSDGASVGWTGIREDLVARARTLLDDGSLESDAHIETALDRLLAHVF